MSTRFAIAYGMIAAIALAGFVWLWFGVLRHRLARRRHQRRSLQARREAQADHSA